MIDFKVDKLYTIIMFEEKIKLRISNYISRIIVNDCFAFNCLKKDNTPNLNKFMNKLIPNLLVLRKNRRELIHDELANVFEYSSDVKRQERLREYIDTLFDKIYFDDGELDRLSETIWIRPKKENMHIFDEIAESELKICQIDLSCYLRSLLNEYAKLQQHKRETIYFNEEMTIIHQSIEEDNVVNFIYKGQRYSVIMLNYFSEFLYDQNNYIIGYDLKNHKIKSIKLHEIENMYLLKQKGKLNNCIFEVFYKICKEYLFNSQDTFDIDE